MAYCPEDGRNATRLKVVHALDEYMTDTPLEKVRVVELCRRAKISRTTFYECFEDISAVCIWLWDYLMEQTLYQAGIKSNCFEAHLRKFEALLEYRHFLMCSFKATDYTSITQHGGRAMQANYEQALSARLGRSLSRAEQLEIEFFVTGAKHMTRHWVENGMQESPELMAHVFANLMPAFALELLDAESSEGA